MLSMFLHTYRTRCTELSQRVEIQFKALPVQCPVFLEVLVTNKCSGIEKRGKTSAPIREWGQGCAGFPVQRARKSLQVLWSC
jgi:hypothetical protein